MTPALIGLGSNLGDRKYLLRAAVIGIRRVCSVVRLSDLYETAPIGSPPGSPHFLNAVAVVLTSLEPGALLGHLHRIEQRLGRRRSVPNAPRFIDLDLILYGAVLRSRRPALPHPRFRSREFVLAPLRELALPWVDPRNGDDLAALHGSGEVRRVGSLF